MKYGRHLDPFRLLWFRCDRQITADSSAPISLTSTADYVAFASLGASREVQLSMRLRTRSTAGLIAYCAGHTHPVADRVLLRLGRGRPRLTVNWGSGPLLVQSAVDVSDGQWHTLEVIVDPSSASLFVDGRRSVRRAHLSDTNLLNLASKFFVGAAPDARPGREDSRRGIIGCVDRIRIRGRAENWQTVLSSSPRATTECVTDMRRCNRTDGSVCPDSDPHQSGNNADDSASNVATRISVVEGGRVRLTADLIRSISSSGTPLLPAVRFRAETKQLHGRLSVDGDELGRDADQIEFSLSDLAQSRVWYIHDDSETTTDGIRLYADRAAADDGILLPVNIIPSNDAPVIRLPPNDTLTLVADTMIQLTSDVLSAVDPDDVSSNLEFNVYPSSDTAKLNSGYFELVESGGAVRSKISRFTQNDIDVGRVFYAHRGSATHFWLLDATDRKDASGIKRLTVVGLPLSVAPVVNTGSSVARGGNVVIGADALSFATNAPYLALDIRYRVVDPPLYGELQKLVQFQANDRVDGDNRMWITASSFTQTQLDESRLRYVHDPDAVAREDYFLFRVSAVGAGQRTEGGVEYHFRLTVVGCTVNGTGTESVFVHTVDRELVISSGELRYVSSLQRHSSDDIVYRIRSTPRLGDLLLDRQLDGRPDRRRRLQLTSGDRFTQADVDSGRLAYRMYPTSDPVNDTMTFDVTTSCASLRRLRLSFRHRATTTGNARLINAGLTYVPEGGSAVIGPEKLGVETVDDRERRSFLFSVTEPARHGTLLLRPTQTGSRNSSAMSDNEVTSFGVEDIASGRLRYAHDGSETRNDSFLFTVSGYDVMGEPEVVFSERFPIEIALVNDNVPRRVNEAALEVVWGVGHRLGAEHLKYVDEDTDTVQLDFTWEADPEALELVMSEDHWTPIYHFTQTDVDSGRVYVRHYSGSENTAVLWVSDGLHFVTDSLVVRASDPFLAAGNGSVLTVVAGQLAVVSVGNLGFTSNIDAELTDIVYQVGSRCLISKSSSK